MYYHTVNTGKKTLKKLHLLFAVFALLLTTSCRDSNRDHWLDDVAQKEVQAEILRAKVDSVWEYAQNKHQGFTLNLATMQEVKFGISVGYIETQNGFGKEGLAKAIEHALKHGKIVGGWLDDTTLLYYFDSVKIFKNSEINEAIEFAKTNKQFSIFDLTNLKEIRITED